MNNVRKPYGIHGFPGIDLQENASQSKRSPRRSSRSYKKQHLIQQQEPIQQYYSKATISDSKESDLGNPPSSSYSFVNPDLGGLSRMKKIVLELRQELTQLTGRMSLQGQKRFSYHQKLLLLQNEIDRLIKAKQGLIPSLPIVLLDDENSIFTKDKEIIDLQRRINMLQQRIIASQLETERQIALLIDQVKRKDRIIQNFNDKVMAEVAASKAFQQCIDRIKDNLFRYRNQIGNAERLMLEGVQFPNVGSFQIRPDILAREDMIYSRNRWVIEYRNQMLILFRELERLHAYPDAVTEIALERIIEGFLMSLQGSRITDIYKNATINVQKMKDKFAIASALIQSSIQRLRVQYPHLVIELDTQLINKIGHDSISVSRVENGVVFLDRVEQVLVEVPIIQNRNIMMAPTEFVDIHLSEEFSHQADRLKNTAFHLRVLIKALLEELEKMKLRTGYPLQIDERVIVMINQEAGGIIDVEDVLRVFQVRRPEDQIIIQSQPQRIIEVPEVVIVDKVVEKIVQVERIREIERIVNVPIEVPRIIENIIEKIVPVERIVERIVEVPIYIEKIVEIKVEVPKIIYKEVIVEHPVEVERIIEVERQINRIIPQPQQIEVIVEKIVQIETIVEKIIEVPIIIEKIVQRVIKVPQVIEIEVIVEKIVKEIEYVMQPEFINRIQVEHKIVQKIIQKPIPIIQVQERIVEVIQIVQKIVEVRTIQQCIVEVEVIREKLVIQDRIKEIEIIVERIVPLIKEIQKIVEVRVEIPVIVQRPIIVQELITKPIIQRVVQTIIQEVQVNNPVIIKEPTIVEVQKIINHYIEVPNIIKVYQDRIVEVPVYIDRIKQVRVVVEKIVEKLVEVPKIIQIEKIVEKIVIVPRVIEKIVEVPQITEVPIDRVIVEEIIREVQRIIEVPVIHQSIRQLQVIKNVFVPMQKIIETVVQKLVECPIYEQKVIIKEIIQEKIVQIIREIPRQIQVQQIVHNFIEKEKIIQVEKNILIPVEILVPTEAIVQKVVPCYEYKQIIVQVPQIVEKIVQIKVEDVQIHQVQEIINNVVIDKQIISVPEYRVVIEKQIVQIPTTVEKIVPINCIVDNIIQRQHIVEKVVQSTIQVPKIYQVERIIEKIVNVPQVIEIETLVPQIVKVNNIVEKIVEKIIKVPTMIQHVVEVLVQKEKIVAITTIQQQIVEIDRFIEKPIIVEKIKEIVRDVNHIEQQLKIVERVESVLVPIISKEERIIEVPHIIEKIVERIVIMPQVKETLKYVHEISQVETLGAAVTGNISVQETQYKMLIGNITENINVVVDQLKRMILTHPHLQGHTQMLIALLTELNKLNKFSRVIAVPVQKIVQKPVQIKQVVQLPAQDEFSLRRQLSLTILVEKLIVQLARIKRVNPSLQFELQDDIRLLFLPQLQMQPNNLSQDFSSKLMQFESFVRQKFSVLGNWTHDHQLMLNSFLQQRFILANMMKQANLEIQKTRAIADKRLQGLRRYKASKTNYQITVNELLEIFPQLVEMMKSVPNSSQYISRIQTIMDKLVKVQRTGGFIYNQPFKLLEDLKITDERILSLLRQKQYQIFVMREKLTSFQKHKTTTLMDPNILTINELNRQIQSLKTSNATLTNQMLYYTMSNPQLKVKTLNQQILQLEQDKADLQNQVFNLRNQLQTHINVTSAQIQQYKIRLSNSGITTIADTSPRRFSQVTNSIYSPVSNSIQFSPRNPTDSLAFSASPYTSNAPPVNIPNQLSPSMVRSSQRTPLIYSNNRVVQYPSAYSARENIMLSRDSIPEVAHSEISNQQYVQQPINQNHLQQFTHHPMRYSTQQSQLSVPGVNYNISRLHTSMNISDSTRNQPNITTSYQAPILPSSPALVQSVTLPQVDSRIQSSIRQSEINSNLSPNINSQVRGVDAMRRSNLSRSSQINQPLQHFIQTNTIEGTIPFVPRPPPTTHLQQIAPILPVIPVVFSPTIPSIAPTVLEPPVLEQSTNYMINNVLQSNIHQPSNIESIESLPQHIIPSSQDIHYQLRGQQEDHNIFQNSIHSNLSKQKSQHLIQNRFSKTANKLQTQKQLPLHDVEMQSLPELHSQSHPFIPQNHSEEHLPWPQSPNYNGLQPLSSNRGSEYSGYSGYSDRKSNE